MVMEARDYLVTLYREYVLSGDSLIALAYKNGLTLGQAQELVALARSILIRELDQ